MSRRFLAVRLSTTIDVSIKLRKLLYKRPHFNWKSYTKEFESFCSLTYFSWFGRPTIIFWSILYITFGNTRLGYPSSCIHVDCIIIQLPTNLMLRNYYFFYIIFIHSNVTAHFNPLPQPFILFGARQPKRACVMFRSSTCLFHPYASPHVSVLVFAPHGSFVPPKAIRGTWHVPEKTADVVSLFASATETFDNVGLEEFWRLNQLFTYEVAVVMIPWNKNKIWGEAIKRNFLLNAEINMYLNVIELFAVTHDIIVYTEAVPKK